MPDQNLVDNIRKENYTLQIYTAFNNNKNVIGITTKLIQFVQDIYRNLEPGHFKGQLIIYTSLDDSILLNEVNSIKFFDKNILINNTSEIIIFQLFQSDTLPLMWQNVDIESIFDSDNAVIYSYKDFNECFYANKVKINVINSFDCASIYALQYHYLSEALLKYKEEKIRFSSCAIFKDNWFDLATRIYFKQQPEKKMQESLKEYLSSFLRGVDVVREYNLNASKPVDVRVYWKEANRAALIELKWLGHSKRANGELSTAYTNGRGNDGLVQLKEYMDMANQDTPTCITKYPFVIIDGRRRGVALIVTGLAATPLLLPSIITKGYLVIIDGRRRGVAANPVTISADDGMFYSNKEIEFDPDKKYYESMSGFEKPIRMFATPVCS